MQTTGKGELRTAKQTNQATMQHPHTHTRMQQRHKRTRWNSVSTKPRQACNRNQTNSNDFSALFPYKGIGTPSKRSAGSADNCSCLQTQILFRVCLVAYGLLRHFFILGVCWRASCQRSPICIGVVSSGSPGYCQSTGREQRGIGQAH